MKFSTTNSIVSALALTNSVFGIENAAVYKFNNNDIENIEQHKINSNKVITIPQNDAILNLAYEFGISNYYNIEDVDNLDNIVLGNNNNNNDNKDNEDNNLILVINGVENPSELFKYYDINPTFNVELKDDRHSSNFKQFIKNIPNKLFNLNENFGYKLNKLSNEILILSNSDNKSNYLKKLWIKYFHDEESNKIDKFWNLIKSNIAYNNENSNNNSNDNNNESVLKISKNNANHINDKSFINELTQLEFLINEEIENNLKLKNDKIIINLDSLITIFKKTGLTQTYKTCSNLISKILIEKLNKLNNFKSTIIVLPLDQSLITIKSNESFEKKNFISKRDNNQVFSTSSSSSGSCFSNQLACIESTDSCSDHGICSLIGSCWKCICSATTDDKDRTNYWTGNSCEKQDYSSQFNLLFWTTIILSISIVAGIKLLYQCGETELPGVLLAATVQTKKST